MLRFSSGSSTYGAIVISPSICICGKAATDSTRERTSSVFRPNLLSSCATFTSIRTGTVTLCLAASCSIVSARRRESTEWIRATLSTIYLTLLRCRCPIMCQRISDGSCGTLSMISCTLFSPKSLEPASYAS